MSRENVDVVRGLFAAFNEANYGRCFDLIDPSVEWEDPASIPGAGVHRGHDGVRAWFARWLGAWDTFSIEGDELVDAGENVIVTERISGVGRTSGVRTEQAWVAIYTVRDGRVVRRRDYPDRGSALEAVGLRE